jgi:hypothetical protein
MDLIYYAIAAIILALALVALLMWTVWDDDEWFRKEMEKGKSMYFPPRRE